MTQAQSLAQRLKDTKFDLLLCSEVARAKETLEVIQGYLGGQGRTKLGKAMELGLLNDIGYGVCQGMEKRLYLESVAKSRAPFREYKPKGGESLVELHRRIDRLFLKIACTYIWDRDDGLLDKDSSKAALTKNCGGFCWSHTTIG